MIIINRKMVFFITFLSVSVFAQQQSLYTVLENVFYKKQKYVNDKYNDLEVLKSLNLQPEIKPNSENESSKLLQNKVFRNEITEIRQNQILKGSFERVAFSQCVFDSIVYRFPGVVGSFKDKALECYKEKVPEDAASASIAAGAYGELDSKSLQIYTDLVFNMMRLRYCSVEAKAGLQKDLSQCSGAAAKLLFQDIQSNWESFSKNKHAIDIPRDTLTSMDKSLNCPTLVGGVCSSTIDENNAIDAIKNIYSVYGSVVDVGQADLVSSIAKVVDNIDGLNGLSYLFNVDRISKNDIPAIWGNGTDSNTDKQKVNITIDSDLKVSNFYHNLAKNYLVQQLYPTIDLTENYYFATNNNSISLISADGINQNSVYWPVVNNAPQASLQSIADSKLYRANNLAEIKNSQTIYSEQARRSSMVAKAAMDVLGELIALRMPNNQFKDQSGNVSSIQEWEKTTAFMRQNSIWHNSIKQGQIADVLKQIAILSSEIRTQLYLNGRQLQLNNALQAIHILSQSAGSSDEINAMKQELQTAIENYRNGGQEQTAADDPEAAAAASISEASQTK